jgi:hypothetical protein
MAESIITLGIGATPVSLTPFITSGLLISSVVIDTPTCRIVVVVLENRVLAIPAESRVMAIDSDVRVMPVEC